MGKIASLYWNQHPPGSLQIWRGKVGFHTMWLKQITNISRHNEHDAVSNHWRLYGLLNHLFRRRSKKNSKLHISGLCEENSLVNPPHKRPVMQKMYPFDGVIMSILCSMVIQHHHWIWHHSVIFRMQNIASIRNTLYFNNILCAFSWNTSFMHVTTCWMMTASHYINQLGSDIFTENIQEISHWDILKIWHLRFIHTFQKQSITKEMNV